MIEINFLLSELEGLRLGKDLAGKYINNAEARLEEIVDRLVSCGFYPPRATFTSIDKMVGGWGVYWHFWDPPYSCWACGVDLRDHKNGPPGKREIMIKNTGSGSFYVCPDCGELI